MTWQLSVYTFCTPKHTRKAFTGNFLQKKLPKDCWLVPVQKCKYKFRLEFEQADLYGDIFLYIIYIYIYIVSQEERSIFWEVIVSVILSKILYMNMYPIPNGFQDRAIWLYSGLAWVPSIVLPSRPAAPLSEACESVWSVEFSNFYYKLYQLCHLNNKYRC